MGRNRIPISKIPNERNRQVRLSSISLIFYQDFPFNEAGSSNLHSAGLLRSSRRWLGSVGLISTLKTISAPPCLSRCLFCVPQHRGFVTPTYVCADICGCPCPLDCSAPLPLLVSSILFFTVFEQKDRIKRATGSIWMSFVKWRSELAYGGYFSCLCCSIERIVRLTCVLLIECCFVALVYIYEAQGWSD